MKTIKTILLAGAAALSFAAIGCGGDDTNVAPKDGGGGADTGSKDAGTDAPINPSDSGGNPDTGTDSGVKPLPTGMIDRMGRPAINTALNFHDDVNKDKYNQEATFQDWTANHTYDTNFETYLEAYDKFGGDAVDWPLTNGVHPLRDALKTDVLIIDTGADCNAANSYCEKGYLEIEAALLPAIGIPRPTPKTCGGRTLPEDIIDKTLTLLITKGRSPIKDNVDAPTKPATRVFPYLADKN